MKTNAVHQKTDTLVESARALFDATADLADEKVHVVRQRLADVMKSAGRTYGDLQDRALEGVKATDRVVRRHPYQGIAIAFGIGAILGSLLARRHLG